MTSVAQLIKRGPLRFFIIFVVVVAIFDGFQFNIHSPLIYRINSLLLLGACVWCARIVFFIIIFSVFFGFCVPTNKNSVKCYDVFSVFLLFSFLAVLKAGDASAASFTCFTFYLILYGFSWMMGKNWQKHIIENIY